MTLFSACQLTIEEVESELRRPLSGSPSSGEIAVLLALDGNRIEKVRDLLLRDGTIGADLRELIERRVFGPLTGETKAWTVHIPVPLWNEYAQLARIASTTVGQSLVAAIQRDAARRRSARDTAATLEESMGACRTTLQEVLAEGRAIVERMGAVQEIAVRLARLEKAVAGLTESR